MPTLQQANGTQINRASFPGTVITEPNPKYTVTADVYESYKQPGESGTTGKRKKFHVGQVVSLKEIEDAYGDANATKIAPATGPAAGGTVVTITGENLDGATAVTFGGTAGTAFSVLSDKQVRVTSPAKAAGTYAVVVTDDSGAVAAGNFIYT